MRHLSPAQLAVRLKRTSSMRSVLNRFRYPYKSFFKKLKFCSLWYLIVCYSVLYYYFLHVYYFLSVDQVEEVVQMESLTHIFIWRALASRLAYYVQSQRSMHLTWGLAFWIYILLGRVLVAAEVNKLKQTLKKFASICFFIQIKLFRILNSVKLLKQL